MDVERLPPQSIEAEKAVLGSCLRLNAVIDDVLQILSAEDFYMAAHQIIFSAIVAIYEKSKPVDLVSLAEALKAKDHIADIGGYEYLGQLWDASPTAANAEYYAKLVHDKSLLRKLIHASTEILRDAYDGAGEPMSLVEDAEKKILEIGRDKVEDVEFLSDVANRVCDEIDERCKNDGQFPGVPTGFIDIDVITGGLTKGSLIIIGARPSAGKTAFAAGLCLGAAKAGVVPLFVSIEQARAELAERALVGEAEVNSQAVRLGKITADDVVKLSNARQRLGTMRVILDDRSPQTVSRIAATSRRMKRKYGIGLVFIDYLQLIEIEARRADRSKANRQEEIASISRRLKLLARELGIPVVCLAQLNRAVENRADGVPKLSDLRESGAIEQDADVVLLLHRPELYKAGEREGEMDVYVAKQRNGMIGTVTLTFRKECMRFYNHYAPAPDTTVP